MYKVYYSTILSAMKYMKLKKKSAGACLSISIFKTKVVRSKVYVRWFISLTLSAMLLEDNPRS